MASSAFSNTSTGLSVLVRSFTLSSAPYTIRSAVDFLPLSITWFMNLARIWLPYLGSGRISRFAATRHLGMISPQNGLQVSPGLEHLCYALPYSYRLWLKEFKNLLRTLGAVLGTTLLAVFHTGGIQGTANSVVTHTRQVLYTAAANQNDAVLLQVVAFTTDIGRNFKAVGQAYAADLTQSRVRLLRRGGIYTGTYTTALRAVLQRGHVAFF